MKRAMKHFRPIATLPSCIDELGGLDDPWYPRHSGRGSRFLKEKPMC